MPAPYNATYLKIGRIWFLVVPSGGTVTDLDSNAPVGSMASDPDNDKLYFLKSTGWKQVTTA